MALNKGSKHLNAFFRAVFYAPVVASVVAVSVVWRYILQKDGLLNSLLAVFGIAGPDWLHDTRYALPALMVMTIWRNMGTLMIIFLAGLQAIPEELKEAAAIDGASRWQILRKVVLPISWPTISVLFVFFFVWTWNEYMIPMAFLMSDDVQTIPLALATLQGQRTMEATTLASASLLSIIPTIIFFIIFQRKLSQGITAGAVK